MTVSLSTSTSTPSQASAENFSETALARIGICWAFSCRTSSFRCPSSDLAWKRLDQYRSGQTIYTGPRSPLDYETGKGGLSFSPDGRLLAFSEWNGAIQRSCVKVLSLRESGTRFLTTPPPAVQGHNENRFEGYGRAVAVFHGTWKYPVKNQ